MNTDRAFQSFLLSIVTGCLQAQTAVSGRVVDITGKPVSNAQVIWHAYGPFTGMLPETLTAQDGLFSLSVNGRGPGVLAANAVTEGHPNAAWAFYNKAVEGGTKDLDLEGAAIKDVVLRFGKPRPVLTLNIRGLNGEPLRQARVDIVMIARPEITGSFSVDHESNFDFDLPDRAVAVTVSCPSYAAWKYSSSEHASASVTQEVILRPSRNNAP